jgi:hypothetical protein
VEYFLDFDAYESRMFATWEIASMLKLSQNKRNHFKEKDVAILFKNLKLKAEGIPIDTLLDII